MPCSPLGMPTATSGTRSTMTEFAHRRRHTLTLTVQADDIDYLRIALEQLAVNLHMGEHLGPNGCSAGWSSSHSYTHVIDEDMTGDRYRELLSEWFEAERANR